MFQFLIPAAAALIGGSMQARAAKSAAQTSAEATDRATELQRQQYEQNIARQQPFLQGGTEDYNRLRALMSGGPGAAQNFLQMDPGYQFRLSEGMKALDRQAAARGGLISGGALRAAQRYGQDLGSQEFGAAYNRLAGLADVGPRAAGVMSGLAQNFLQMDPGYQFRLSEGMKALDRQAAARGGLISGGALRAAQRYGQDLGSQEFGAAYNRLAGLADVGPRAAGVMSGLGQTYATNVGNMMLGQGQTAANAALARGSAYSGGLNQLGYLAGRYYGQPQTPNYAPVESRDIYSSGDYYGPAMPGMPGP